MAVLKGASYLLDCYITCGELETINRNEIQYTLQRYQGNHENEFLLRSETGDMFLYENNVLKQQWQENEKGVKSGEFIVYKNGRVDFQQQFADILEQTDSRRIVNHIKGRRMEIWSSKTGHLTYHGGFNDKRQKEGWGIEYDEESRNVVVEGIWSNGTLIEVIRLFNGDTMTELKRNGKDSLDPVKRIPIYVGGFRYDEDTETFVREGKGCLIDEKTGIAYRECEWKDGKEIKGIALTNGYYDSQAGPSSLTPDSSPSPILKKQIMKPSAIFPSIPTLQLKVIQESDLEKLNIKVTDLVIDSNSCNSISTLILSEYKNIRSIDIGNDCFGSAKKFCINGLKTLKKLKIGRNSFTRKKGTDKFSEDIADHSSYSFHVLDCDELEIIEIMEYSFFDFSGEFELKNLPSLQTLNIGLIGSLSNNFYFSSFQIRCLISFYS